MSGTLLATPAVVVPTSGSSLKAAKSFSWASMIPPVLWLHFPDRTTPEWAFD